MKKLIKLYLVMILVGVLSSCSNSRIFEHKSYNVTYNEELNGSTEVILSHGTYSNFIAANQLPNEYELEYFENKFLVVVYLSKVSTDNCEYRYFKIENNTLVLDFETNNSDSKYDCTMLFLIEFDNRYIDKFNNIQIILNDIEIKNNIDDSTTHVQNIHGRYGYYNGMVKCTRTYDEYHEYISEHSLDEYKNIRNLKYTEEFFQLNSIIILYLNAKSKENDIFINTIVEGNNLIINVNSLETYKDETGYICIIEVDNKILNMANNIEVVHNDVNITNQYDVPEYKYFVSTNLTDISGYGDPIIIDTWQRLIKHSYFNEYFDYYRTYDFENKSLILFIGVTGSSMFFEEVVKVVENNTMTISVTFAGYGVLTVLTYHFFIIEVDNSILENTDLFVKINRQF